MQEVEKLLKDYEFYQYLIDNDYLVNAMEEFADILSEYIDSSKIQSDEKIAERNQIIHTIVSLSDKDKLDILNCTIEEEGDYENIIYNPITSRMDDEVLKTIILSLSEEERIKFLLNPNNRNLHFRKMKNPDDKIEIFNSLSEENKLRIFSEYTTITTDSIDERWTYKFIPFLDGDYNNYLYGKLIKENLNDNSKIAILKNEGNKYDYILDILRYENFYGKILNETNEKKQILQEKLKRFGSIDGRVLSVYRFELINYLQNESD